MGCFLIVAARRPLNRRQHGADYGLQFVELGLSDIPDDMPVQLGVAVGHEIANGDNALPWQAAEVGLEPVRQTANRLANDEDVHDDSIERQMAGLEISEGHAGCVGADTSNRLKDVVKAELCVALRLRHMPPP
jgi:hypothetical protein